LKLAISTSLRQVLDLAVQDSTTQNSTNNAQADCQIRRKEEPVTWKPDFNPDYFYFITTKAVDYLRLFQRDDIKRLILDTLDCFRLRRGFILQKNPALFRLMMFEKLLSDRGTWQSRKAHASKSPPF